MVITTTMVIDPKLVAKTAPPSPGRATIERRGEKGWRKAPLLASSQLCGLWQHALVGARMHGEGWRRG